MTTIPATLLITLSLVFSGSTLSATDEAHLKNTAQDYLNQQQQVLSVQSAPKVATTGVSVLDLLAGNFTPDKPKATNPMPATNITPAVAPLLAPAQAQAPKAMTMFNNAYEDNINPEQPSTTPLKPTSPASHSNPIKLSEKRDANGNPYPSIEAYIADTYVLATDKDFIGDRNGQFMYAGSAEYVIVPEVIKGVKITSTACMFKGSVVKGVICDNPAITDMRAMFWDARSNEIEIIQNKPRSAVELILNTSNVKDMSWMFHGAIIEELILTSFDTSKVEDFSVMFEGARAKTIDVSTFNTKSAVNFGGMFRATLPETLNIKHFDTSNAEILTEMFAGSKVKTLDLRHFDTSGTRFMNQMFSEAEATSIDISRFNFGSAYDISWMFHKAKNVLSVDFSNLLVTGGGYLQKNSLTYDSSIKTIYINQKQNPDSFRTYAHPDAGTNLIHK